MVATSEILRVIHGSPTVPQPLFDPIMESASQKLFEHISARTGARKSLTNSLGAA